MLPEQVEIPFDVAYVAAVQRAERLTKALILSEAQVLTLQQRVTELEAARLERQGEFFRVQGGVMHDAAQDGDEGSATGGEAGAPHPFHD